MPREQPSPRFVLARNLRALIEATGWSEREVAKRAGVDPKTVNNQVNSRADPRPDMVQAVAQVFNLTTSQLMDPNFDPATATNPDLQRLIALYAKADTIGRENILRIAEMASGK